GRRASSSPSAMSRRSRRRRPGRSASTAPWPGGCSSVSPRSPGSGGAGRHPFSSASTRPGISARWRPATMTDPFPITATPEWGRLAEHHAALADVHLRTLFANDPKRGETMTVEAGDLVLDYSKNRITAETIGLLAALAVRGGIPGRIEAMWRGERINTTEHRPVLHIALRMPRGTQLVVDGEDVVEPVHHVLDRMALFA